MKKRLCSFAENLKVFSPNLNGRKHCWTNYTKTSLFSQNMIRRVIFCYLVVQQSASGNFLAKLGALEGSCQCLMLVAHVMGRDLMRIWYSTYLGALGNNLGSSCGQATSGFPKWEKCHHRPAAETSCKVKTLANILNIQGDRAFLPLTAVDINNPRSLSLSLSS